MVEQHFGYQLKRAQHVLRLRMDEALAPLGITVAQYAALSALEGENGLSNAELARRCFVTAQTMNPIVVALARCGWIRRNEHPEHGRILQAFLTAKGRECLMRAHQTVFAVEERMLAGVAAKSRRELTDYLKRCADNLA